MKTLMMAEAARRELAVIVTSSEEAIIGKTSEETITSLSGPPVFRSNL